MAMKATYLRKDIALTNEEWLVGSCGDWLLGRLVHRVLCSQLLLFNDMRLKGYASWDIGGDLCTARST